MNKLLLLAFMFFMSELSLAVCNSPIARTNFTYLEKLTSTRLNSELNTVYSQVNELPGDCITSETITTSQILNGTIVNNDISPTAAISRSKLAINLVRSSLGSGSFITTSGSNVDVTNLSLSITVSANSHVELSLDQNAGSSLCLFGTSAAATSALSNFSFFRDSTEIYIQAVSVEGASPVDKTLPGSTFRVIDSVTSAGTYTYKMVAKSSLSATASVFNCKLLAREL